jgi:hypothetical protein
LRKPTGKMACFSFIEGWYNPVRLHSALGYRAPMAYEAAMEAVTAKSNTTLRNRGNFRQRVGLDRFSNKPQQPRGYVSEPWRSLWRGRSLSSTLTITKKVLELRTGAAFAFRCTRSTEIPLPVR